MLSIKDEVNYGTAKQKELFNDINKFFGGNLKPTKFIYARYDFYDNTHIYELKSRKCSIHEYPSTVIALNKIDKKGRPQVFIFAFTDGIYYIRYDKELFDTFELRPFKRNSLEDMTYSETPYFFIPTNKLSKLIV